MRPFLAALAFFFATAVAAQSHDYQQEFQKGIAALNAGRHDEGIASFVRCIELNPKDGTCAYNVACGYALKKEVDKAFEWLDEAVAWGFGNRDSRTPDGARTVNNAEFARLDADLDHIKADPRWAKAIARMAELRQKRDELKKRGEAYAAKAAMHMPEKVAALEQKPLLVVLHPPGSTKDEVVQGRWKQIAEDLGFALLAPSGKFVVKDAPVDGMDWFDSLGEFMQKPWTYEKSVHDAVAAFRKEHKVEAARVFLAGEGAGGLIALNIALGSPGLYKGVLSLDGPIVPKLMAQKGPNAGKMGLKLRVLVDAETLKAQLPKPEQLESVVASWRQAVESWGIAGDVTVFTRDDKQPEQVQALLQDGIKKLLPVPVEGGAAK